MGSLLRVVLLLVLWLIAMALLTVALIAALVLVLSGGVDGDPAWWLLFAAATGLGGAVMVARRRLVR